MATEFTHGMMDQCSKEISLMENLMEKVKLLSIKLDEPTKVSLRISTRRLIPFTDLTCILLTKELQKQTNIYSTLVKMVEVTTVEKFLQKVEII